MHKVESINMVDLDYRFEAHIYKYERERIGLR
ncbi:MAG: hypothetical protein KR126chlam2_00211 [Chlamydiae bacterium]|nr:hypothetical protein [Chlamydiota bacterium]